MSKKFNPLSAAVALATAGVMVAVGGCAMGTHSNDMSTAQAPLSREESQAPGQQQMAQTAQADTSMTPSTAAAPADTWTASSAQAPQTMARNDTSATPYPNSTDTQQPQPAATTSSSTDYSRGTSTDYSASTPSAASTMNSSTDTSSSTYNNGDQPLPARADRN